MRADRRVEREGIRHWQAQLLSSGSAISVLSFSYAQYATVVKPRVDDSVEQKDDEVHYVYVAIKGKKK
jgi:hypothetical protein